MGITGGEHGNGYVFDSRQHRHRICTGDTGGNSNIGEEMSKSAQRGMTQYLPVLTAEDQAIICNCVRKHNPDYPGAHPGLLPFLSVVNCVLCLQLEVRNSNGKTNHRIHSLLHRLEWFKWQVDREAAAADYLTRCLSDRKVYARFGQHPERGVPIPGLQAIEKRPRARKMFERKVDAYDNIRPMMTLRRFSPGVWGVSFPQRYRHYVEYWLVDNLV